MAHAHPHTHGAGCGHGLAAAQLDRAMAAGVALNTLFVAVEAAAGVTAGSLALLADAGHNAGDVLGLLLAWGASWLARRPPSRRYTWGLRRSTIYAALGNAVLLLLACSGIAWEAVHRLRFPEAVAGPIVIAVAGWIQGALGLGFPMVATPLIAAATNMQFAVVMVVIPCIATVIVSILRSPGSAGVVRRFWWISIVALLGAAVGARLFVLFPGFPYALLLAGVILFYLNLDRLGLSEWPVMKRNEKKFGLLFGFLGGLSETTANIAAPPLIIYYLGIGLPPLMLVPAMNISFLVGKSTQFATLAASGIASPMHWLVTLPLAVIATVASLYGSRVRSRIDGETYRIWMRRMLLTMALILLTQVAYQQLRT